MSGFKPPCISTVRRKNYLALITLNVLEIKWKQTILIIYKI